jgi:hypothetical protein
MTRKTDILLRQSQELMTLRERSTSNITSSSNAFLTFLGLVSAALALFIKETGLDDFSFPKLIILISVGLAVFWYGCFIHHHIWAFFINQIFYTRKINLTRAYLIRGQKMLKRILLPTEGDTPGFNDQGVLKEEFSKIGVVHWIKCTNIVVVSLLSYAISMLVLGSHCMNASNNICISLIIAIIGAGIALIFHDIHEKKVQNNARDKWSDEIKFKDLA